MIQILINEAFKKYLLQQSLAYRKKIRQKFEYLEIGYWDGGLKVKKIKGVSGTKAVFEARLDRSNRLLFTLGTEKTGNDLALLVYLWGVVGHDDISTKSRHIPRNVPFLQFQPLDEKELRDSSFEELTEEYYTQESITQKIADDSATQKWHFLDQANWERIEKYRQDEFEMALYLTPEQQAVLEKPLPILVSGTAGSGKTTLSIYYLLKLPLAKQKKLFITYNKYLRNAAHRLYHGLLNGSSLKDEYVTPDFFTFKGYCLDIISHFNRRFPPEKEVNFDRFYSMALSHGPARKFDLPLIWEEIRSIIKGALPQINVKLLKQIHGRLQQGRLGTAEVQALQQQFFTFAKLESTRRIDSFVQKYLGSDIFSFSRNPRHYLDTTPDRVLSVLDKTIHWLEKQRELTRKKYLSFADYEALGKKKAPHFHHDRKQIYQIFEWYQDRLDSHGLWDELDLTREVINLLNEHDPDKFRYDLVVCDEVQDLTDIQHELLFYIVRDPRNVLLTGDIKQIINPSGFRWEELKRHFYERDLPVPEITSLKLNFRSSGSIVELSNILLELKSRWLGVNTDEFKEEWKYKGRPPIVVKQVDEARMLESLKLTGARKTILVRHAHEKERLQKLLGTELVFTIYEAKGLEFDTVLLWKFASDLTTLDVWKAILEKSNLDVHQAKIRHEVNLLYVAITRAQKDLLIYDGKQPSLIWESNAFREQVYLTDDIAYVDDVWNVVSSPEEWHEQGDYFFEREYYRAAMECYKNAGDQQAYLLAHAYDAEKRQDWKLAAKLFDQLGETEKAATYYERSGGFARAFSLWQEAERREDAMRCRIELLKRDKNYAELAKIYLERKEYALACDMLERTRQYKAAAELYKQRLKNNTKAAELYEKAKEYATAARLYQKAKNLEKAAVLFEKAGEYTAAEKHWKKLNRQDRLEQLYEKSQNVDGLLKIYEKRRDFDAAVKVLRKNTGASNLITEADRLMKERKYFPALIRYYVAGQHEGAAKCFMKLKQFEKAAQCFERVGDMFHAGKCYSKTGNYKMAIQCYVQTEEERKSQYWRTKRLTWKIGFDEQLEIAQHFLNKNDFETAKMCYLLFGYLFQASTIEIKMGNLDKGFQLWKDCLDRDPNFFDMMAAYCIQNDLIEVGARFILHELEIQDLPVIYTNDFDDQLTHPNLFKMMDLYFSRAGTKEELSKWARCFSIIDKSILPHYYRLSYLARAEKYYDYLLYLINLQSRCFKPDTFSYESILYFEISDLIKKLSRDILDNPIVSAIHCYFKGDLDRFHQLLTGLPLNEETYFLYLLTDQWEKAEQYVTDFNDFLIIRSHLEDTASLFKLARLAEKKDISPMYVAALYQFVGAFEDAARAYIRDNNFYQAAECYVKAKQYEKAIEMYQKTGKNQQKIARLYEKLEKWQEAAAIWKRLGKTKKYKQCMEMLNMPNLFDA